MPHTPTACSKHSNFGRTRAWHTTHAIQPRTRSLRIPPSSRPSCPTHIPLPPPARVRTSRPGFAAPWPRPACQLTVWIWGLVSSAACSRAAGGEFCLLHVGFATLPWLAGRRPQQHTAQGSPARGFTVAHASWCLFVPAAQRRPLHSLHSLLSQNPNPHNRHHHRHPHPDTHTPQPNPAQPPGSPPA